MAYSKEHLFKVENLRLGRTVWDYLTTDTAATVDTAGYFNEAKDFMRVGDLIIRTQADSVTAPTTITAWGFHMVVSNDGTNVDIADALAGSVVDTD